MKLVTYRDRDRSTKPGVLLGEEIVDISDQVADVRSLIEEGPDALRGLRTFLQGKTRRIPLAAVELLPRSKTRRASSALDWHIAITPLKRIKRSRKCRRSFSN